ncbi:Ribonuclease H [Quillaja saponaria]|uniref:Ribonuclease H n=1 Tax=Quillaja saponaria TaxID=32244 RepID=A0AAD7PVG9_QUISA|nr:Ribonuclease H [Quillaja saponaria]
MCNRIQGLLPPTPYANSNCVACDFSTNGSSSIRSAYDLLSDETEEVGNSMWKLVWKWTGPQRIQTNEARAKRLHGIDPNCGSCMMATETCLHVIRDCFRARTVLVVILQNQVDPQFYMTSLKDWVVGNLEDKYAVDRVTGPLLLGYLLATLEMA